MDETAKKIKEETIGEAGGIGNCVKPLMRTDIHIQKRKEKKNARSADRRIVPTILP